MPVRVRSCMFLRRVYYHEVKDLLSDSEGDSFKMELLGLNVSDFLAHTWGIKPGFSTVLMGAISLATASGTHVRNEGSVSPS